MSEDSFMFDRYFPAPYDLRLALGAFSAWLPFDHTFYCVAEDCNRGTLVFTAYPWVDVEIEDEETWQKNVEKKLSERGGYDIFPRVSNTFYVEVESYLKEIHYWELWYLYRLLQLESVEERAPVRFRYECDIQGWKPTVEASNDIWTLPDHLEVMNLPEWWVGKPERPYELYVLGERPEGRHDFKGKRIG